MFYCLYLDQDHFSTKKLVTVSLFLYKCAFYPGSSDKQCGGTGWLLVSQADLLYLGGE